MRLFVIYSKKYSFLLGLLLFAVIMLRMNLGNLRQAVKNIEISYIIIAFLITFLMLFIKSWCWNYILRKQGIKYNLKDSFLMYCAGVYLGIPTPGRIGELAKAFYIKRDGHSFGKSLVGVILDRFTDLIFLLGFAFLGSLFFVTAYYRETVILFSALIIVIFLIIALYKSGAIKWGLKKAFYFWVPEKNQNSWKINFQEFINDLKIYNLRSYSVIMLITTLSWLFYFFQMYVLAQGVGIHVPLLYLSITVTIAGLITLIPVSVSGIGTRDAALILLLSSFLIPKERIIVFSALMLLISLFATLIGLICWIIKPIRL